MVQMEDETYKKIIKDADDNRALSRIIRNICITIITAMVFIFVVMPVLNIQIDNYRREILRNNAVKQAEINVQIREIESKGLTVQEYLKWLEIKRDAENDKHED